jgi:hypothetical protein
VETVDCVGRSADLAAVGDERREALLAADRTRDPLLGKLTPRELYLAKPNFHDFRSDLALCLQSQ